MKIRSVGAELFHADSQTDKHDEVNSRFRNFAKLQTAANKVPLKITFTRIHVSCGVIWP